LAEDEEEVRSETSWPGSNAKELMVETESKFIFI